MELNQTSHLIHVDDYIGDDNCSSVPTHVILRAEIIYSTVNIHVEPQDERE